MKILHKLNAFARLVKFEHTVFALPFALTTLMLSLPSRSFPEAQTLLLVLVAMTAGRTYAMGLNRIADARIDALNPRTASREIPRGVVSMQEAWGLTLVSLGVLVGAVLFLPLLCLQLLPVAIALLTLYSYMKRFSSLCHVVLGLCLGSSAIAGWVAQTGQWHYGLPVLFGAGVACWVIGFDIIYACQDVEFDQAQGLHSIPARIGIGHALQVSRWMHGASVVFIAGFGVLYDKVMGENYLLGWLFWLALGFMAFQLIRQHRIVNAEDLTRVNEAFFTLNGQISVLFFSAVLLEKCVHFIYWV
jgi:4-hydroxybenzoate polyprenyltransferase